MREREDYPDIQKRYGDALRSINNTDQILRAKAAAAAAKLGAGRNMRKNL